MASQCPIQPIYPCTTCFVNESCNNPNSEISTDISIDTAPQEGYINNLVNDFKQTEQPGNFDDCVFNYENRCIYTGEYDHKINNQEDPFGSALDLSEYYDAQYGEFYDMYDDMDEDNNDDDVGVDDDDLENPIVLVVTV